MRVVALLACFWRVHWSDDSGPFGDSGPARGGSGPLVVRSLLLSALSLCLWCAMLECGSISRFKGVFRGFYGVYVDLCRLRALHGLCGFCARVELGGLKACGVFASIFLLSTSIYPFICLPLSLFVPVSLSLPIFSALSLLSSGCPVVLSLMLCIFLFPFGIYAKRKGAPCWCVLSWCVVGCGFVMQNKAFRYCKIRNRWSRFLRLYIRLSKHIRNHFATARKNLREGSRQIPAR